MDDQVVRAYHKYMTDVAEILGANRELAAKELEKSLEFEIELAKVRANICFKNFPDITDFM